MDVFLGVDAGSVSINIVAINNDIEVVYSKYIRTNGQLISAIKEGLKEFFSYTIGYTVRGVGTTGSGRQMVGLMVGADVIMNEISTHAAATMHYYPEVRTIFEIGGQDSKIILLQNGLVVDFSMNTVCAAGTGSFLDHQAERLSVPIEAFGDLALTADKKVRIAGRCTVFAESDMIAKQQYGFSKADIVKGLCDALVRNYINNLGRGKNLKAPFVFQGGVAANKGIVRAFEEEVKTNIIIPKYYNVMGAIGSAIFAKDYIENESSTTKFRGVDIMSIDFTPDSSECTGCSNNCELIRIAMDSKNMVVWGDRCGKFST